ncbi:MAG: hypothetical protein HY294_11840 [Candidatus Rokubacteria bacterium]|nr:hypothetical protein [Candidatus Rokubacteria bacterium]MBI3826681.1 hypothetical protein [Candidatus Rokubacteria bacterium]
MSQSDGHLGAAGPDGGAHLWIIAAEHRGAGFHRKRPGINHVAFRTGTRDDVDAFKRDFLDPRGLPALYGTPRDFPELELEVVHLP